MNDMQVWIFMSASLLSVPLIMIIIGLIMEKHPPKNINTVMGYRTRRSMKNLDTWKFAHDMIGKIWFKWGIVLLVLTLACIGLLYGREQNTVYTVALIAIFVQMIPLCLSIIPVERALKRVFDEDGNRRENVIGEEK